jgi:predicted nucleotidyltransferase
MGCYNETMNKVIRELPELFRSDVQHAVEILKSAGCSQVFLFGSTAVGGMRNGSDIDLAIRGCPPGSFFHLLGNLLLELDHPIDLIDLDSQDPFVQHLKMKGDLVEIG